MNDNYELEYKKWAEKLRRLDEYINSLEVWNDYAEDCQRKYDYLLSKEPKRSSEGTK
jgi:hypothetical protein